MTLKSKYLISCLCFTFVTLTACCQRDTGSKKDTVQNVQNQQTLPTDYQNQITELHKEIASLTQTVASTKESFYNSRIYLWTFIITALGLIIVIVGFFGYKSISDKIGEIRSENDSSRNRNESALKEIKNDLIQRITELKNDMRDFKTEQNRIFEKFEKDANDKIKQGLDTELSKAIEKVMKGSFEDKLNDLTEQVNSLSQSLNILTKTKDAAPMGSTEENVPTAPITIEPKTNAFDDEQH